MKLLLADFLEKLSALLSLLHLREKNVSMLHVLYTSLHFYCWHCMVSNYYYLCLILLRLVMSSYKFDILLLVLHCVSHFRYSSYHYPTEGKTKWTIEGPKSINWEQGFFLGPLRLPSHLFGGWEVQICRWSCTRWWILVMPTK